MFYTKKVEPINEVKINLGSEKEAELKISDLITIGVGIAAFFDADQDYYTPLNTASYIIAAHYTNKYIPMTAKLLKEISIAFNNDMLKEAENSKDTIKLLRSKFRFLKSSITQNPDKFYDDNFRVRLV